MGDKNIRIQDIKVGNWYRLKNTSGEYCDYYGWINILEVYKRGVKVYKEKLREELMDKEEKERTERKHAKKKAYKERRAAKREQAERERLIEIQKEAYVRAMMEVENMKK